jgi:hypothetical protein
VKNFVEFPPLGLVLVGLLGIGVAERSGLLPVLLRRLLAAAPGPLLVPMTVLVGVLSSLALDAGYVVLPPLAGALFLAAGRSPLAGIAAVTAGVTCGFSANLFITGLDPLLAGLSTAGAHLLDPDYAVAISANWWFMIASTLLLTAGRRLRHLALRGAAAAAAPTAANCRGGRAAARGAGRARRRTRAAACASPGWTFCSVLALLLAAVLIPGAPLAGEGARFPRWMEALVPLLLMLFLGTGIAYGIGAGSIKRDRDAVDMMGETMRTMGPYLVLAFFAAQFIACFGHSRLGEMLAVVGGGWLAALALPPAALMLAFIGVVMARQPAHRLGLGQVRLLRAGVRAHVHAGRHQPGADPGGLPGRRLRDQRHHAVQPLPDHHPGLHAPLSAGRRARHPAGADAALHAGVRAGLGGAAGGLGGGRLAARARRRADLVVLSSSVRGVPVGRFPGRSAWNRQQMPTGAEEPGAATERIQPLPSRAGQRVSRDGQQHETLPALPMLRCRLASTICLAAEANNSNDKQAERYACDAQSQLRVSIHTGRCLAADAGIRASARQSKRDGGRELPRRRRQHPLRRIRPRRRRRGGQGLQDQ